MKCHMPIVIKSSIDNETKFKSCVKTHFFYINSDPNAKMFLDHWKFARNYLTLDFAHPRCLEPRIKYGCLVGVNYNLLTFAKMEATCYTTRNANITIASNKIISVHCYSGYDKYGSPW